MAHATYLRDKARSMRIERQLTIDELAERLALSRSTVYYWVRDLPIPGSGSGGGWPEGARRKGTPALQLKYTMRREEAYRQGLQEYEALAADPTSGTSCVCTSRRGTSGTGTGLRLATRIRWS
jgi:excisionase family DNA binding protein